MKAIKRLKKMRQTSVIRRMYAGFTLMVILFISTVLLMLNGTSRVYQQLESVNSDALPLVTFANQTSVELLMADKFFKDFLTSQDLPRMDDYESKFSVAHQNFSLALAKLAEVSVDIPALSDQLNALFSLEKRYFSESNKAMNNYRAQLATQQARQDASRRFQKLQGELRAGMKEFVNNEDDITLKMISKSYFMRLKYTETVTSDALASFDIKKITKAIKANKVGVARLKGAYASLTKKLPALKNEFSESFAQFSKDVGEKEGILDLHYNYAMASNELYRNIAVLAGEVDQAMDILETFRSESKQVMNSALNSANEIYKNSYSQAILMGSGVTTFALFLGWLLARNVRKPLVSILKTLEMLTAGDMTQRVDSNTFVEFNQLSTHINTLASNLQDILHKLGATSGDLAEVAAQNQSTMAESRARLNEQRQQTASVATAMTEMEHSVRDVAASAQNSMDKVRDVESATQAGREVMSNNISTIHKLSEQLNESVQVVATVQNMSSEIGSILDVIRHIAAQTNLLALNAAIEAARAGEQGRGFAVVADEVRVLAKRTTDSTAEIEEMIKNLQDSSKQASSVMQSCVIEMDKSLSQSSEANGAMEDIQANIIEISKMSYHIVSAAEEQSATAVSIARNLEDISQIADANNASMEKVANVSSKLDELAHQQNELVHRFNV
ncbi:methyl-accepting chemotaxis protein [Psychromonas hadalis]|uniref:methyl-accepting chemotaxis protein n=1 Tax=Psychromonas hadalis TaxID=211669 RepID=UPI0003B74355|nr:methyl-accepting chemotaxis protein [Psychromonas hadalis]